MHSSLSYAPSDFSVALRYLKVFTSPSSVRFSFSLLIYLPPTNKFDF